MQEIALYGFVLALALMVYVAAGGFGLGRYAALLALAGAAFQAGSWVLQFDSQPPLLPVLVLLRVVAGALWLAALVVGVSAYCDHRAAIASPSATA